MGIRARAVAVVASIGLLTGCFGYNRSAKRWAYVGDTLLVLGGGATIALDVTDKREPCMDTTTMPCPYRSSISGMMVTGALLAGAGLVGMIFNATRPNIRTSR